MRVAAARQMMRDCVDRRIDCVGLEFITRIEPLEPFGCGSNAGGGCGVRVYGTRPQGVGVYGPLDRDPHYWRDIYKFVTRSIDVRPYDTDEITSEWHALRAAGLVQD